MGFCGIKVSSEKNNLGNANSKGNFSGISIGCISAVHVRGGYRQSQIIR